VRRVTRLDGGATAFVSALLVLLLGGVGLWAGHAAGQQAEAVHRGDRLAQQVTLGNLVGQYAQVAALEMTDILNGQSRAGAGGWSVRAGDPRDAARLRSAAEGSRALSAGAAVVSALGVRLTTYSPIAGALPPPTDPGWAPLRAAVLSRRGVVPVSGVLHVGDAPVVAVAVPTLLSDGQTGLLIGLSDLRVSALERYVHGLANPDGRVGYVVDGRGLVVAGPDVDEVGRQLSHPHVRAAIGRGGNGVVDVREGGATVVTAYAQAGETGWSMVTLQDRELFLGALQRSARRAQAALVLLLLCAGGALLVLHRRREGVLRAATVRDELTGALNRRGWYDVAGRALTRAARDDQPRGLLFMDLDGLKGINDALGHEAGDQAITAAVQVLRTCTRSRDVLGRLGGDEFVLLLADSAAVEAVRDRIRRALTAFNARSDAPFELRLSVGTAVSWPGDQTSLDELVRAADSDMYADKHQRPERLIGLVRPSSEATVRPGSRRADLPAASR
jgi:diguanylate cyclase (GGDEF)-like protein